MILTGEELILLNSLSGGGKLFGVAGLPAGTDTEELMKRNLENMDAKGFRVDGRLTDEVLQAAKLIAEYRTASYHCTLNRLRMAELSDQAMILLAPVEGGKQLLPILKADLVLNLLKSFVFLCRADGEHEDRPITEISPEDWAASPLSAGSNNGLTYSGARDGEIRETGILYAHGQQIFHYKLNNRSLWSVKASTARIHICRLLHFAEDRLDQTVIKEKING